MKEELRNEYLRFSEKYRLMEAREEKTLFLLSVLRLACFAGGSLTVVLLAVNHKAALAIFSAVVFIILFLFLLRLYSVHSWKKLLASRLAAINNNEASALTGDMRAFRTGSVFVENTHDFSYDTDLFGEGSLFQYLNRTITSYGEELLAGWLSDPYSHSGELKKRQEIIKEIASHKEWRDNFMASGMDVPVDVDHAADLGHWLNESSPEPFHRRILIYILPLLAIVSLLLVVAGLIHYSVLIAAILINLGYVASGLKSTNKIHRLVSGKYEWLESLNRLIKVFGDESFSSPWINEMKKEIAGPQGSAASSIAKLGKIIQAFDARLNMIAGFGLNALLVWDYQCIRNLEKWKQENSGNFTRWLKIIAEVDSYISLGNYAYNNKEFAWPEISATGSVLEAEALGHPLIPGDRRICNDFVMERQGTICIITGANMAGKSTFLRTVAVNLVLAMTGSPVCASKFLFTPVKLFTSMRTTDSLSGNESYFYAELRRLRTLLSKIKENTDVFFILDEILKGTNSADKALGSKLFLNKLISNGATGMIATHDISLADLEKDHPASVFNMCFEIEIDGAQIRFDYLLRKGITRKMNAALLMRQMGILD